MTDSDLLAKIQNPKTKRQGFTLLMQTYQEKVYGLTRKMVISHEDADDIVQEVFIKIYKSIDTFQMKSQLFTWVYRITVNECLSFLRKKRRRFFFSFRDVSKALSAIADTDSYHNSANEIQKKLQKALSQLSDKQRLVFHLRYYDDLPYEDISCITHTSVGSLKASYHHARKKVEKILEKD